MGIIPEETETKKGMDTNNKRILKEVNRALEEITDDDRAHFFRERSDIKNLSRDYQIRIDCAPANNISDYPEGAEVWYLQVQYMKVTYANVRYTEDSSLADIKAAILASVAKGIAYRVVDEN